MHLVFFAAFSIVAAILFNYGYPKLLATSWAQSPSASTYIGKTLVTGVAFFAVLIVAGLLMSIVTGRETVKV